MRARFLRYSQRWQVDTREHDVRTDCFALIVFTALRAYAISNRSVILSWAIFVSSLVPIGVGLVRPLADKLFWN